MVVSAEGNEALVRHLYEDVWNRGDLAVADEVVSAVEVHHSHGLTVPGGPEMQKQAARIFRAAFSDVRFTIEVVVNGGDLLAVRWRAQGTHAATGRRVTDYTGVNIFRVANDQIVEIWDTRDDLGLFAQLGLIPPPTELRAQAYPNPAEQ
jgi:predicted SnoaL-like aldol condensation-catalyzing enzyme